MKKIIAPIMNAKVIYLKVIHRLPLKFAEILNKLQFRYPRFRFLTGNILKIPINKIIVGDIHGISSYDWYLLTNDFSRFDKPITESPYFELFKSIGAGTFNDSDVESTSYYKMAFQSVDTLGEYCGCKTEKDLKAFVSGLKEFFYRIKSDLNNTNKLFPILRPIKDSEYYEIVDGHHRISIDAVLAREHIFAYVIKQRYSGLQKKMFKVQMTRNKELYQPLDFLTTRNWPVIRKCIDRFDLIKDYLIKNKTDLPTLSMVDLACSYGYFVKLFKNLGIKSLGVEIDQNAIEVGKISYGLNDDNYVCTSLQDFLFKNKKRYDIVCFFSILHHFGLHKDYGGGGLKIYDLIKKLSNTTTKYLFLDSGQNHEDWFREKLPNWDEKYIADLVMRNSDFKNYKVLGKDTDNVGKFSGNYGRTLFVFEK